MGIATPATPTPTIPACTDESTMELDRPREERKNLRDAMADKSPAAPPSSPRAPAASPAPTLVPGAGASSWKPWARPGAWREGGPVDVVGYRLELVSDSGPVECARSRHRVVH